MDRAANHRKYRERSRSRSPNGQNSFLVFKGTKGAKMKKFEGSSRIKKSTDASTNYDSKTAITQETGMHV